MLDFESPSRVNGFPLEPKPAPPFIDCEDPNADLDRLGDAIAELSAHIQAATYRLLVLIREFDQRGGWGTGFRSCAHWLNWRTGLDLGAAREKVRVARALEDLPRISDAMRQGKLSYSKVRALTRVAKPENETELLEFALSGTAAHVESLVRAWRRVDRFAAMEEGQRIHEHRSLSTYTDEDGMLVLRGRLTPEVGAMFTKAIEAAMEALFRQAGDGETQNASDQVQWQEIPIEQRRADALELLAESALEAGLDPGTVGDRYQVVVHLQADSPERPGAAGALDVSAETSPRPDPKAPDLGELESGEYVSAETSRRIACEASRVVMSSDAAGTVLDVGRKTRAIHPAMRRALNHRDGGCRFPGCTVQHCDAHHVEHWADGGETNLDNLMLLCRFHHRALHEGGFRVVLDADGSCRFYSSEGSPIPAAPPPPEVPGESAVALSRSNWRQGLEIDRMSGLPGWYGESLDLNRALEALRGGLDTQN